MELTFKTEQKVCEIGGVKFGGQPGQYPTVVVPSIFQKGDRVFEGAKRKEGFNEDKARELLQTTQKLSQESGVPAMVDIVANTAAEFETYVDFVAANCDLPFCIDAWQLETQVGRSGLLRGKGPLGPHVLQQPHRVGRGA
jgi:tetrahydromethanopterin S-methyltransferase subunit H